MKPERASVGPGIRCSRTDSERIRSLMSLGYIKREAGFLLLVALHSGYFVRRQYQGFAGYRKAQPRVEDAAQQRLPVTCPRKTRSTRMRSELGSPVGLAERFRGRRIAERYR